MFLTVLFEVVIPALAKSGILLNLKRHRSSADCVHWVPVLCARPCRICLYLLIRSSSLAEKARKAGSSRSDAVKWKEITSDDVEKSHSAAVVASRDFK